MNSRRSRRHARRITFAAVVVLSLASAPALAETPSGTVKIDSKQLAFIISGNLGKGSLDYKGKTYAFSLGGLGVGGIGVAKLKARGNVFKLEELDKFSGTYVQVRAGATAGKGRNVLTLSNQHGVYMELEAATKGVALQLGADGMKVQLEQ